MLVADTPPKRRSNLSEWTEQETRAIHAWWFIVPVRAYITPTHNRTPILPADIFRDARSFTRARARARAFSRFSNIKSQTYFPAFRSENERKREREEGERARYCTPRRHCRRLFLLYVRPASRNFVASIREKISNEEPGAHRRSGARGANLIYMCSKGETPAHPSSCGLIQYLPDQAIEYSLLAIHSQYDVMPAVVALLDEPCVYRVSPRINHF